MIIGVHCFGSGHFQSNSPAIRNIEKVEISNVIVDEVSIRENTDLNINTSKSYNDTFENGQLDGVTFE